MNADTSVASTRDRGARHILSLSGGKDSTALAIHLRERIPHLEYVFCDTEKELPETYEYLGRLEALLGVTTRSSIVFTCVRPAHDLRIAQKPPLAVPDGVQGHDPHYRATKTMSNKHCSW
jgi:3'-phosphoadenosine 5'-phosphosulfate sulfotransferase (PAPS reductase)/FAD synthetase